MSVSSSLSLPILFLFRLRVVCVKGSERRKKKITFVGSCTTLISIFRAEASRPRVTSNCVSNWLLPMQLRLCHTRFFTVWGTGERSSFWRTTVALQQIQNVAVLLIFWRSCSAVITSDINHKRKVTEVERTVSMTGHFLPGYWGKTALKATVLWFYSFATTQTSASLLGLYVYISYLHILCAFHFINFADCFQAH